MVENSRHITRSAGSYRRQTNQSGKVRRILNRWQPARLPTTPCLRRRDRDILERLRTGTLQITEAFVRSTRALGQPVIARFCVFPNRQRSLSTNTTWPAPRRALRCPRFPYREEIQNELRVSNSQDVEQRLFDAILHRRVDSPGPSSASPFADPQSPVSQRCSRLSCQLSTIHARPEFRLGVVA